MMMSYHNCDPELPLIDDERTDIQGAVERIAKLDGPKQPSEANGSKSGNGVP